MSLNKNPFIILPPMVRLYLYLILSVCALGFAAWKTADGDPVEAVSGFVTMLINLMAASNVDTNED